MVLGVFSILPEWSLTPVGNFMDMFKDSQTVPLHEEGHARPLLRCLCTALLCQVQRSIFIYWSGTSCSQGLCIQTQETQICKVVLTKHGHGLNQNSSLYCVWSGLHYWSWSFHAVDARSKCMERKSRAVVCIVQHMIFLPCI